MKQNLALLSILLVGFFSLDCAGTQQDTTTKTQNVDFLINQGKLNWEQRTDSLALKNAEHFISLAYERRPTQLDLAILYGQILYTRGLFIEKNILAQSKAAKLIRKEYFEPVNTKSVNDFLEL